MIGEQLYTSESGYSEYRFSQLKKALSARFFRVDSSIKTMHSLPSPADQDYDVVRCILTQPRQLKSPYAVSTSG